MRFMIRWLCLALCLATVFCLVGCEEESSSRKKKDKQNTSTVSINWGAVFGRDESEESEREQPESEELSSRETSVVTSQEESEIPHITESRPASQTTSKPTSQTVSRPTSQVAVSSAPVSANVTAQVVIPSEYDVTAKETGGGIQIATPYYSVTVPSSWKNEFVVTCESGGDSFDYALYFRDKISYEADLGGKMFMLYMFPQNYRLESNYYAGHFSSVANLTIDGESYYMIVAGPSDVQFTDERYEQYEAMRSQRDDILRTIKGTNGTGIELNPQLKNPSNKVEQLKDYLGMTIDRVKKIHGKGCREVDFGTDSINFRVMYYNDNCLPVTLWESRETGKIEMVEFYQNRFRGQSTTKISSDLDVEMSVDDLREITGDDLWENQLDGGWGFTSKVGNVAFSFWYPESDFPEYPDGDAVASYVSFSFK